MSSDSESRNSRRSDSHSRSRSRERRHHQQSRQKKVRIRMPELSQNLYSLKQFSNLQTDKTNPETVQKAYDKYRKEWEKKENEQFIAKYKNDAWFNEKYNPQLLDMQQRQQRAFAHKNMTLFVQSLQKGHFDSLDLTVRDPSLLGTTVHPEEDDDYDQLAAHFTSSQTVEVHLSSSIDITAGPFFGFDPDQRTLFIRTLSKNISRYDIQELVEKMEGFRSLAMSDPLRKNDFTRNCWVEFDSEENTNRAAQSLTGVSIKEEKIKLSKAYTKVKRIKILRNYPTTRLEKDLQTVVKLIGRLDANCGIQQNELLTRQFASAGYRFDLLLLYLRKVHSFDFFTCQQFENERLLALKVGSTFLRMQANYHEMEEVQTVFKKVQQSAEAKAESLSVAPEYMGLVREEVEKFIHDSERGPREKEAWKCLYCDKKFKTCEFLAKHMIAKHEDIKAKKIDVVMERLYLQDPNKVTNYFVRDESKMRKAFGGGYRRERRREVYKDLDEPEPEPAKTAPKGAPVRPLVNFLDI